MWSRSEHTLEAVRRLYNLFNFHRNRFSFETKEVYTILNVLTSTKAFVCVYLYKNFKISGPIYY